MAVSSLISPDIQMSGLCKPRNKKKQLSQRLSQEVSECSAFPIPQLPIRMVTLHTWLPEIDKFGQSPLRNLLAIE